MMQEFKDFAETTHLIWIAAFIGLDVLTGNLSAIKRGKWNSDMMRQGALNHSIWLLWLALDYAVRKCGIQGGDAFGWAVEIYMDATNFGSILENLGIIQNDETVVDGGKKIQALAGQVLTTEIQQFSHLVAATPIVTASGASVVTPVPEQ